MGRPTSDSQSTWAYVSYADIVAPNAGERTVEKKNQSVSVATQVKKYGSKEEALAACSRIDKATGKPELTLEQFQKVIEQMTRMEVESEPYSNRRPSFKVSRKGALSVYGLQRLPVTLYAEQWLRIIGTNPQTDFGKAMLAYIKSDPVVDWPEGKDPQGKVLPAVKARLTWKNREEDAEGGSTVVVDGHTLELGDAGDEAEIDERTGEPAEV